MQTQCIPDPRFENNKTPVITSLATSHPLPKTQLCTKPLPKKKNSTSHNTPIPSFPPDLFSSFLSLISSNSIAPQSLLKREREREKKKAAHYPLSVSNLVTKAPQFRKGLDLKHFELPSRLGLYLIRCMQYNYIRAPLGDPPLSHLTPCVYMCFLVYATRGASHYKKRQSTKEENWLFYF